MYLFVKLILLPYDFLLHITYANDCVEHICGHFEAKYRDLKTFLILEAIKLAFLTGNKCGHASMQIGISENV